MTIWKTVRLSDVIELQRGHDLPVQARRPGDVPVLGSNGIVGFHNEAPYKGPGVTIGRSGVIGGATYTLGPYWPLNTCLFVKDFKGNHSRWVYYWLKSTDFSSMDSGSAQPSLNRNYIAGLPVLLPPVNEQRAIADILGALDDKIAINTQLAETTEMLAHAYLHDEPATVMLGDIVTHERKAIDPSALGDSMVAHFSLPAFDAEKVPEVCAPFEIKSNKFLIQKPSVLISKLNPRFPRVWDLTELPKIPAVASTEFLVLEPICSSPAVLRAILSQKKFGWDLESKVAGTSGSHQRVKPADLLETKVVDPRTIDSNIQTSIMALSAAAFHAREENLYLVATRNALLPQLMTGKLRVKDAEALIESVV